MEMLKVKKIKKPRSPQAVGRQNKGKSGQFERDTCRQLSKWWTGGKRDDVLCRTAGSGGRATVRAAKGVSTANSAGDIGYLDVDAEPLLRAFTFELKKGYPAASMLRLIDSPLVPGPKNLPGWFAQARAESKLANSLSWAVIHGPPRKPTLIYLPAAHFLKILELSSELTHGAYAIIRAPGMAGGLGVAVTMLDNFLRIATRAVILEWLGKK